MGAERRPRGRPRPPVVFRLPENFRAADLLPPTLARYADAANHLVDRVVTGLVYRRGDARGFVRLKVEFLRRVIPDRVERTIRETLIDRGVLECDPDYVPRERSRGYRLAPSYRTRVVRVPCGDAAVAARVRRVARRLRRRVDPRARGAGAGSVDGHLRQWLARLEIDVPVAIGAARQLDGPELHVALVEEIARGVVEYRRCRQGRVHTSVTRLARAIRPALHFGGARLCQLDVANAQPLLLGLYMLRRRPRAGIPVRPDLGRAFAERQQQEHPASSIPSDRAPPCPVSHSTMASIGPNTPVQVDPLPEFRLRDLLRHEDERRYVALCEVGVLYETLVEHCALPGLTRDRMKKRVMIDVLCGKGQRPTAVSRGFARSFPNVMRVVRRAKRDDHGRLARALQRLESGLIIDGVCGRLMREHPDVPIVTLHDALLTTPAHVEVVRGAILAEFARVGLRPRLKIDWPAGQPECVPLAA